MTTDIAKQILLSKQANPKLDFNFTKLLKAISVLGGSWAKPPEQETDSEND